jgi:hypothetical protein
MRRLLAFGGALAGVAWCGALYADESEPIYFGGTCLPDGVDYVALLKILRAELSPRPVAPLQSISGASSADVVVLGLNRCTDVPPSVTISVWHGMERRERTVVLADVPEEDRTRTLALALAETRLDPAVSRPANPEPVPWETHQPDVVGTPSPIIAAPPAAQPISAEKHVRAPWELRASLAFRYATSTSTPAGGVFAGVEWPRFGAGASVFGARRQVPIGEITLWVTSATAYYDLVVFTEWLRVRGTLDLGAAIATGAARTPARGETQSSFNAALHAGIIGTLWRGDANEVQGGLGVGYASSLRAQANGAEAVSMDGLLLTAELGLGFY